jgi:lysophospholipase L1-like esterase
MCASTVLTLALLLLVGCHTASSRSFWEHHRDVHQHAALQRLRNVTFVGPEKLMHHAVKYDIQGRNWPELVHRLYSKPNSTFKIVTLGGSVSVGYKKSNTSYPEEFVAWLQQLYPAATFQLTNLARRATAATFAALCLVQHVPADADLVIIEYSVNGHIFEGACQCFTDPQVAGYETLLRKVITKAPKAAFMSLAAFLWTTNKGEPTAYHDTGEDQQAVVTKRYGVPFLSVRDALYDAMWDPASPHGVNRSQLLVDHVHVSDYGAKVYASILGWGLRHQVTRILLHSASAGQDHPLLGQAGERMPQSTRTLLELVSGGYPDSPADQEGAWLPRPLNPEAAQERWSTFCANGLSMKEHVVDNKGWEFVDEGSDACGGCHKYGYATQEPGASITFKVDSAVLSEEDKQSNTTVQLAVSYLRSYQDMGMVRLECVSGCTCAAHELDGAQRKQTSEMTTQRHTISDNPKCLVRLTVLDKTNSKNNKHKFRVSSVAVHKQDSIMSNMYAPRHER